MTLATPGNDIFRGKTSFRKVLKPLSKSFRRLSKKHAWFYQKACVDLPKSMQGFI
jgi:hypothetical protein